VKAVRNYSRTESHITNVQENLQSSVVDSYFMKTGTSEKLEVSCAELVLTDHLHHHTYLSRDCGNSPLSRLVFTDSRLASKIHCGHIKVEALVENVWNYTHYN
jgi:hypothetical protein